MDPIYVVRDVASVVAQTTLCVCALFVPKKERGDEYIY